MADHDVFAQNSSDYMFKVLTHDECDGRKKCVAGIAKMLDEHSTCHPVLSDLLKSLESTTSSLNQKAVFLFALHSLDDFVAYVMEQPNVCCTSVSLFKHKQLPVHTKLLLNGNCTVLDYVVNCTVDYICT